MKKILLLFIPLLFLGGILHAQDGSKSAQIVELFSFNHRLCKVKDNRIHFALDSIERRTKEPYQLNCSVKFNDECPYQKYLFFKHDRSSLLLTYVGVNNTSYRSIIEESVENEFLVVTHNGYYYVIVKPKNVEWNGSIFEHYLEMTEEYIPVPYNFVFRFDGNNRLIKESPDVISSQLLDYMIDSKKIEFVNEKNTAIPMD